MKIKRFLVTVFVLILCSSLFGQQNEVLFQSRLKNKLMIEKDTNGLKSVLCTDLLYIHSSGKVDDLASILATVGGKDNKILRQDLRNEKIRIQKNIAILTGILAFKSQNKENISEYDLIITEVWKKEKKKWLLWSRHATRAPSN
jgi:hypothetical protein